MPAPKRIACCFGWLLLLGWAGAVAGAETLTIATYNLANYVAADRMTTEGFRPAYPKPEAEKAALRRVIRDLHADVLALQEMGPSAYLEELRRDLRAEQCEYPYALLGRGADPDRHVAVLSRRPFVRSASYANLEFAYLGGREPVKRGLVEVTVATSAGEVTVFALHLKSRLTERPEDPQCTLRRAGEATAIRDLVLRRFPEPARARFMILGDCNDTRVSKAVEHLQRRGGLTVALLVPAADARGETWTYFYRREDTYSRVDHVLVSPALQPAVDAGGASIPSGADVALASDHRPVVVRLELR